MCGIGARRAMHCAATRSCPRGNCDTLPVREMGRRSMTSHRVRFAAMGVLAITLVLPLCAAAAKQPPQTTFYGLELRPNTKLAVVYLRPEADFSGYRKVALLDCAVAFKKDWQRNQNSTNPLAISAKDMDGIRRALGT